MAMTRRDILIGAGGMIAASGVDAVSSESGVTAKAQATHAEGATGDDRREPTAKSDSGARAFNGLYHREYLNQIAFPMGGIGAGMICLEGTGALSKFSLRNRPDLTNEPKPLRPYPLKDPKK